MSSVTVSRSKPAAYELADHILLDHKVGTVHGEAPQVSRVERASTEQSDSSDSTGLGQSGTARRTSITRFILCCDGTKNDGINKRRPRTNVARLARCISNTAKVPQIVFYMRGVGTGTSRINNWRDSFDGRGIDNNIREAYAFLCQNWKRQELDDGTSLDDEIVLIGFSRGAFTVRALAHLISTIGLATKDSVEYINDWFDAWEKQGSSAEPLDPMRRQTEHHERLRPRVLIKACAIWDTVSALDHHKFAFVEKKAPKNVRLVFHALALDEERSQFRPLLWQDPGDGSVTVRECWFLGTHSDVGGGHEKSGLSNLSLAWMLARLRELNVLEFDDNAIRDLNLKTLSTEIDKQLIQRYKVGQAEGTEGQYLLKLVLPDEMFRARTQRHVGNVDRMLRVAGWRCRDPSGSLHWTAFELLSRGWADCKPLQKKVNDKELWRQMLQEGKSTEEKDILNAWIGSDCLRLIQTCEEMEKLSGNEGGKPILVSSGDVNPLFAALWNPTKWEVKEVSKTDIGVEVSVKGDIQISTIASNAASPAPVFTNYGTKRMTFLDGPKAALVSRFSRTTNYQVTCLTGNITIPFHRSLDYSSKSTTTPGQLPIPDVTMQKERGSTRKSNMFDDNSSVWISVKDEQLRVVPLELTVKTARSKANRWKYQLQNDDGSLYESGIWFDEAYLDPVVKKFMNKQAQTGASV